MCSVFSLLNLSFVLLFVHSVSRVWINNQSINQSVKARRRSKPPTSMVEVQLKSPDASGVSQLQTAWRRWMLHLQTWCGGICAPAPSCDANRRTGIDTFSQSASLEQCLHSVTVWCPLEWPHPAHSSHTQHLSLDDIAMDRICRLLCQSWSADMDHYDAYAALHFPWPASGCSQCTMMPVYACRVSVLLTAQRQPAKHPRFTASSSTIRHPFTATTSAFLHCFLSGQRLTNRTEEEQWQCVYEEDEAFVNHVVTEAIDDCLQSELAMVSWILAFNRVPAIYVHAEV